MTHKNDLGVYLANWTYFAKLAATKGSGRATTKTAAPIQSFGVHTYDLAVVLAQLDLRLRALERPSPELDYQAHAEAGVFLKAFYFFFRILLDDISGILESLYRQNEAKVKVPGSFARLLLNADKRLLPEDLHRLLQQPASWFPRTRARRNDLVHNYDSYLVSIQHDGEGKKALGHFSIRGNPAGMSGNVREDLGSILCGYQVFIDNLLDHLDAKFPEWYNLHMSRARTDTIMIGCPAFPVWWAHKYGDYQHVDLHVTGRQAISGSHHQGTQQT